MAVWEGNPVSYGSAGTFRARVEVNDGGSNTGTTTNVAYQYSVRFTQSVNDTNNRCEWTDPWGAGNANNSSFILGAGGGIVTVSPIYTNPHPIQYGGGNVAHFHFEVQNIASVTGTSIVDFNYPLPARTPQAPGVPGHVGNVALSPTAIRLQWSTPANNGAGIDDYLLRVWTAGHNWDGPTHYNGGVGGGGVNVFDVGGLSPATRYYWGVAAHNAYGYSAPSNYDSAWWVDTPATTPGAPTGVALVSRTSNTATLSWSAPASNGGSALTAYRLQVSTSPSFSTITYDSGIIGALSHTATGLTRSTPYYARVLAYNAVGPGPWSGTFSFSTLATAPDIMSAPVLSDITPFTIKVTYAAPANGGATITSYDLQMGTSNTFGPGTYSEFHPTTSPYVAEGVLGGLVQFIRIRAVNSVGPGAWSPVVPFTAPSGAWAKVAGTWRQSRMWGKVANAYRALRIWKKVDDVWYS